MRSMRNRWAYGAYYYLYIFVHSLSKSTINSDKMSKVSKVTSVITINNNIPPTCFHYTVYFLSVIFYVIRVMYVYIDNFGIHKCQKYMIPIIPN